MVVACFVFQVFQEEDEEELIHAHKTHIHYNAARFCTVVMQNAEVN